MIKAIIFHRRTDTDEFVICIGRTNKVLSVIVTECKYRQCCSRTRELPRFYLEDCGSFIVISLFYMPIHCRSVCLDFPRNHLSIVTKKFEIQSLIQGELMHEFCFILCNRAVPSNRSILTSSY